MRVLHWNNIKLFLHYETLLGKIRHNDMICYDYDLDFGIFDKEYNRLEKRLSSYFKDTPGYKMTTVNLFNYRYTDWIKCRYLYFYWIPSKYDIKR